MRRSRGARAWALCGLISHVTRSTSYIAARQTIWQWRPSWPSDRARGRSLSVYQLTIETPPDRFATAYAPAIGADRGRLAGGTSSSDAGPAQRGRADRLYEISNPRAPQAASAATPSLLAIRRLRRNRSGCARADDPGAEANSPPANERPETWAPPAIERHGHGLRADSADAGGRRERCSDGLRLAEGVGRRAFPRRTGADIEARSMAEPPCRLVAGGFWCRKRRDCVPPGGTPEPQRRCGGHRG